MTDWEIIDWTLRESGLPDAETLHAERWTDFAPKFEDSHFLGGFGHADGKFYFKADWADVGKDPEGVPTMPVYFEAIEVADDKHPYRMVAAPARTGHPLGATCGQHLSGVRVQAG